VANPSAGKGHADAHGHGEVHVEHHLSAAPLIIGVGALFTYIALTYLDVNDFSIGQLLGVLFGVGVLGYGFLVWVREDVKLWRDGWEMPGVSPGKDLGWWGMVLFLCTEVMLFGGLFATFFVQRGNFPDVWAEGRGHLSHALTLVSINTVILLSSSVTLHFGHHAIRKGNRKGLIGWLAVTILLGAIFLGVQVMEYMNFINSGLTLGSNAFGSIFYQITGTHGFHVLLGLIFLAIVLVRAMMGQFTAERHTAVEAFSIYWHFVDVVWVFVFTIIYLGVI
jgi:cytochrome c oxidase subunit III